MNRPFLAVINALWELLRYDIVMSLFGYGRIHRLLARTALAGGPAADDSIAAVTRAVDRALSLYWKHVRCLQRSVVTVGLLRRCGVPAELVIGYRSAPFFGHAWIEVAGQVINDSPVYRTRCQVLDRL